MDCIKFYRPPLGSSRAASRFPACREAAIAPQYIPRSGITPGGKQRGPTAATDVPLLRIGHPKDTTSASCVMQKNGLEASPQSQTDDDVGPGGNVSTSTKSDSQGSDHTHDEIASTESREASKGKTRRARDLLCSDKSNNSLEDCPIAPSQSCGDMDFVCRLPKQQRDQYAPFKSSERSWQSAGSHTLKKRDEVVDLTDSDQEGPTPEHQDDGSRESTVEATGADDSDPPTLEELILQAKARRMAVPGASQKPTDPKRLRLRNGNVKDSRVYSWARGSQGEHIEFLIFLSLAADGHLLT